LFDYLEKRFPGGALRAENWTAKESEGLKQDTYKRTKKRRTTQTQAATPYLKVLGQQAEGMNARFSSWFNVPSPNKLRGK